MTRDQDTTSRLGSLAGRAAVVAGDLRDLRGRLVLTREEDRIALAGAIAAANLCAAMCRLLEERSRAARGKP